MAATTPPPTEGLLALQKLAAEINESYQAGTGDHAPDADAEAAGYAVRRDNSKAGHWTEVEKQMLLALVDQVKPTTAAQWEVIADRLGKWSPKGASAERVYRTITDPGYHRATNKHGRRCGGREMRAQRIAGSARGAADLRDAPW